jgi:hypothetical protein
MGRNTTVWQNTPTNTSNNLFPDPTQTTSSSSNTNKTNTQKALDFIAAKDVNGLCNYVVSVANTYYAIGGIQQQISLYSVPSSYQAMVDTINTMGMFANNQDCCGGGGFWQSSGILNFYSLVKYLKQYPLPTSTTKCTAIKSALVALDMENTNVNNLRILGNTDDNYNSAYLYAIAQIKAAYSGWYSTNDCDTKIADEIKAQENAQTQGNIASNIKLLEGADGSTENAPVSYTALYVVGGVLVVGILAFVLIKRN